ncbi:MAG: hypothetical protein HPZ91_17530 [Lentisphaeria bacterium]|nr:hypothetical protein [Lentisphaeria bacterium]
MKKLLFAIAAGCSMLAFQVNADALSILQNTRIKAQQTVSVNNLTSIFLATTNYMAGNKKYPTLEELNVPVRTLANPYHGLGADQKVPDKITAAAAGYAYFGAALNGTGAITAAATTPLAFEKPTVRNDGKLAVLFLSGKVQLVNLRAENCAGVIEALKKEVKDPNAAIWDKLAAAAKAIDEAK